MQVTEWVAAGSTVIALASLLINFMVVCRQSLVQVEALRARTDSELFAWASEAIDAFAAAIATAEGLGVAWSGSDARGRISEAAARLSAVADKGRMFFPNLEHPNRGQHKPDAFRGERPPALHALIYGFYMTERLDADAAEPDDAAARYLFECRRLLIDEVQRALDPKRRQRVMNKLSGASGSNDGRRSDELTKLRRELAERHPDAAKNEL